MDRLGDQLKPKDICRVTNHTRAIWTLNGFDSAMAYHSEFGGATSAYNLLVSRGVPLHSFKPPPCVPRVLKHLINTATPGIFQSIPEPVKRQ